MALDWGKAIKRIRAHLDKKFLLVVRNEDTFAETASYKLSLLNIYMLFSSILLIVSILLLLVIIVTPIKRLIPGYGDVRSQSEYISLHKKLGEMESQIQSQEVYINSLRRLLTGKPQTGADIAKDITISAAKADPIPKIVEDSVLRKEFETSRQGGRLEVSSVSTPKRRVEYIAQPYSLPLSNVDMAPPLRGTLGAPYQPEKDHFGVDIIAPSKSPVKAILDGSVIQADWSMENGHIIAIQHDHNLVSIYKHNSAILKKIGQRVKKQEAIAIIGNTGTLTSGPHLHFELWHNGKTINPADYISF